MRSSICDLRPLTNWPADFFLFFSAFPVAQAQQIIKLLTFTFPRSTRATSRSFLAASLAVVFLLASYPEISSHLPLCEQLVYIFSFQSKKNYDDHCFAPDCHPLQSYLWVFFGCSRVSPKRASCAFAALAKISCIFQHFLGLPEVN